MDYILFNNLEINGSRVSVDVVTEDFIENLWFEFSGDNLPMTSTFAMALATFAGRNFRNIGFDFPVSEADLGAISSWTNANVEASEISSDLTRSVGDGVVLNFSGGFDSLAAKYLLPSDTKLVSLDFGGRFARERKFFKRLSQHIVATNLVETSLRSLTWAFMGLGPLLLRDSIDARYFSFGSIYEATGFRRATGSPQSFTFPPFASLGFKNAAPVAGISEFGTAIILAKNCPELIEGSLKSLALPGEEKYLRKIGIARLVASELSIPIKTPSTHFRSKVHYKFGQNFAVDVTALMFLNHGYREFADRVVAEIPSKIAEHAMKMDLSFLLKANPALYVGYPQDLKDTLTSGLGRAGIDWYNESDVASLEEFRALLQSYYDFG